MALPTITNLTLYNTIISPPEDGNMINTYSSFKNLKVTTSDGTDLSGLRISARSANININKSLELKVEESYDNSVNLIINDRMNPLKIVNSRFYLTGSDTYNIADRKGNLDTNIYTENNFKVEAGLIKTVRSISTLDFLGIYDGGKMPIGNYTFYFKLADIDGNESDFISESGKVICYIGSVNDPTSIRGGLQDEDSGKLIKFRLNNIDLAYDYINIYYSRSTGDEKSPIIKYYKINSKFKINNLNTEISITGYENHVEIDESEINEQYSYFSAVKTIENCQNITFAGNIQKDNSLYTTLEKYSLFITPQICNNESIGFLTKDYAETSDTIGGYEYYNANNIYYKLGYWEEEIYRVGIVYILNDYTLSPVFNIRGKKEIGIDSTFISLDINNEINYDDNYIISGTSDENIKGVFKIATSTSKADSVFDSIYGIKPIGLKFNFDSRAIEGNDHLQGLKDLTKGFFFVRQSRIPTIFSQGLAINTAEKTYNPSLGLYFESFLTAVSGKAKLGRNLKISSHYYSYLNNALLCPEASLRSDIFSNLFNSSEFHLEQSKYSSSGVYNKVGDRFNVMNFAKPYLANTQKVDTNVLFIDRGSEVINNGDSKFCSVAGNPYQAWKHINPCYGNIEDILDTPEDTLDSTDWSNTTDTIRGEFNSYLGITSNSLKNAQIYNIYQKDYDFTSKWKDYFKIRYDDNSPFMAISDRIEWNNVGNYSISDVYRGDCYICTYTHRMLWNFVDPELPTNKRIADPYTWCKNYKVAEKYYISRPTDGDIYSEEQHKKFDSAVSPSEMLPGYIVEASRNTFINASSDTYKLSYKKCLPLFATHGSKVIEPSGKHYKRYAEANGTYGYEQINRPDVNAVPIGHWITFKICSNYNLNLRDLDFSHPEEEALHKYKRGFFPLQTDNPSNKLPESNVINRGISETLGRKYYYEIPDVPFIKLSYANRIHYSDVLQEGLFRNGNRIFRALNYQDYTMEYGALVKLVEWYGTLVAVMEHGILLIPVNERAAMANATGENVYINTENVLPKNPRVISNTYGSIWPNSIVRTPNCIYGIDTVAKKIWRVKAGTNNTFEIISDFKIQKYLNNNINLLETQKTEEINKLFVNTEYNAFKQDVLFNFKNDTIEWNFCWNELLNKWITRYSWISEFSENVNNIFYTFAKDKSIENDSYYRIWKHGFAGFSGDCETISPTKWYNKQEPFEFEFVVIGEQGIQKIFDNLKIISNSAEPESIIFEIVGESYGWSDLKSNIYSANNTGTGTLESKYTDYLKNNLDVIKLPYVSLQDDLSKSITVSSSLPSPLTIDSLRKLNFTIDKKVGNYKTQIYQKACDIAKSGRIKGNMQYIEDFWDIQIQPITFKYAYIKGDTLYQGNNVESKIRDRYIKIRIRYSGTQLAIVNAIKTLYTLSYA